MDSLNNDANEFLNHVFVKIRFFNVPVTIRKKFLRTYKKIEWVQLLDTKATIKANLFQC